MGLGPVMSISTTCLISNAQCKSHLLLDHSELRISDKRGGGGEIKSTKRRSWNLTNLKPAGFDRCVDVHGGGTVPSSWRMGGSGRRYSDLVSPSPADI